MHIFKDKNNVDWPVRIDIATVKRVKSILEINLCDAVTLDNKNQPDVSLLEKIADDPVLLVDILYVICKQEADARSISDEDFGAAMGGDVLENATKSFLDELIDFFPGAKRQVLRKIMDAGERIKQQMTTQLDAELENLDNLLDQQLPTILSSFMNSPESSA
jgi:hypothetical protein